MFVIKVQDPSNPISPINKNVTLTRVPGVGEWISFLDKNSNLVAVKVEQVCHFDYKLYTGTLAATVIVSQEATPFKQ